MVHCAMIAPHFAAMIPVRKFERDDDMKRAHLRSPMLARLPFMLAPLLAFAAPASAQSLGGPVPYTPMNPWSGITVIVTPPAEESAYEAAQRDAAAAPEPASEETTAHVVPSLEPQEDALPPSLWTSLDLGFGDTTPVVEEKPAPNTLLPARKPVTADKTPQLPTRLEILEGPTSVAVSTSASTSAPVSSPLAKSAGGGNGEVKGRVGYALDNLTVYGTGGLGAAESTGAVSVYDNVAVGSTYNVPLGMVKGDSLGATVEMNNASTVTTGVELRAPMGDYQRFISVQRAASPDSDASGVVKAGVLGKF